MPYDSDFRECDVTAVDTATAMTAKGSETPGAFDVPANATRITELLISSSPDWTADTLLGYASGVHIYGAGVTIGEGWFVGPAGYTGGAAGLSGSSFAAQPQRYLCNIPVSGGGKFSADAFMMGEDCGSLRMQLGVVFDGPIVGAITDMDWREESLTAANTPVTLGQRGATAEGDFKPIKDISEIYLNGGLKGVAGPLAATTGFKLSGNGLKVGGSYDFIGPAYATQDDAGVTSGGAGIINPIKYEVDIPAKVGNTIRCQAQMIEDDVGTIFAMVGLAYH